MKAVVADAAAGAVNAAPAEAALLAGDQTPPYGSWVVRLQLRWCMSVHSSALQGQRRLHKSFASGVQAACAADLARLAISGHAPAVMKCLNFPAAVYPQQQVAAMAAYLNAQRPGATLAVTAMREHSSSSSSSSSSSTSSSGSSTSSSITATGGVGLHTCQLLRSAGRVKQSMTVRAAADAAAAEAAAAALMAAADVAALFDAAIARPSSTKGVSFGHKRWHTKINNVGDTRLEKPCETCLQAACAADLAYLAFGKPGPTNLPRSTYTSQQVAAMRELLLLLLLERPGRRAALQHAAEHRDTMAVSAITTAQLAALKTAAVSAAAAAAASMQGSAESQQALSPAQPLQQWWSAGCHIGGQSWRVSVRINVAGPRTIHIATVKDATTAACAADLARLAVLPSASGTDYRLNFPASTYSSQQVAACGALLTARFPGVKLSTADAAVENSAHCSSGTNGSGRCQGINQLLHQPIMCGSGQAAGASAAVQQAAYAERPVDLQKHWLPLQQQQQQQQQNAQGCRQWPAAAAVGCSSWGGQLQLRQCQQARMVKQQQADTMQPAAPRPVVGVHGVLVSRTKSRVQPVVQAGCCLLCWCQLQRRLAGQA
ncbi:hypothetical protein COO60DRAFT_759395 [Scenedesmus sp. NREL 46B-D3]|nr:hypothetical protein COO60DRAFT_759395 [Scenedesmus sp. NREL 46B-D3]